jgi:hypothetical protein|tara:strand:+ start:5735 stop:6376 length:642 start_codon:yes stop_codon:yes gene_type:complete
MKPNSIIPLFSIPLYHTQTEYIMDTKEFNRLSNIEWFEPGPDYNNISVVSNSQSFFKDYDFKELENIIENHKNFYVDEVLGMKNNFTMTQSWVARTKKGSSHPAHDHKNCIFSVVYYARCDSGDLVITTKDNFIGQKWNLDFNYKFTRNLFNSTSYTCKVKTGDIVILPGHIEHFTTSNESDFERYIVGANYFVSGLLGKEKKVTKMDIKINE